MDNKESTAKNESIPKEIPTGLVFLDIDENNKVIGVDSVMGDVEYILPKDKDMFYPMGMVWNEKTKMLDPYVPTALETMSLKIKEIGQHIYDEYPETKQNQDKSYLTVNKDIVVALTAVTQDELSTELVLEAMHYLKEGSRLSSYIANKPNNLQDRYERLYKVSIRLAWCDYCVREGKSALEQNRQPNYPEFPNFKG